MREEVYLRVGCLQSAFSLKISLVLTSASAIANNDVMLQKGIRTFSSRAYTLVYRGSRSCVSWQ